MYNLAKFSQTLHGGKLGWQRKRERPEFVYVDPLFNTLFLIINLENVTTTDILTIFKSVRFWAPNSFMISITTKTGWNSFQSFGNRSGSAIWMQCMRNIHVKLHFTCFLCIASANAKSKISFYEVNLASIKIGGRVLILRAKVVDFFQDWIEEVLVGLKSYTRIV